ncbi:MAG: hypothetical protein Q8K92_18425 [Leadbetterella sp.]|nr:hypothetical protein [Leadbetterella sp.]
MFILILFLNASKGVSFCLMIQKYTTNTALKNRCDEVEKPWDKSVETCENKKKRPESRFDF